MLVVLALVTAASAGTISLSASKTSNIAIDEIITITIVSDVSIQGGVFATQIQTTNLSVGSAMTVAMHSGLSLLPKAGTIKNAGSVLVGYVTTGDNNVSGNIPIGGDAIAAGQALWTMTFKGLAVGSTTISATETGVIDGDDNEINSMGTVTVHVIPEPMTIALLGLGGLFLRRKLS